MSALHLPDNEVIIVTGLIVTTLVLLLLTFTYSEAMFFIDPYTYFAKAFEISEGIGWSFNPFILFLALVIKIYPYSDGLLLFVRTVNLIFVAQLVVITYLVARKILNQFFSILAGIIVLFLPLVHGYGLQLHNDIFTAAMGLTSIFFLSSLSLRNTLIAFPFFIIACATRPDYSIIFALPFALAAASYYTRNMAIRSKIVTSLMLIALVLGIGYIIFEDYYSSTTRFGVFERISIFLNYDMISTVWQNLITITKYDIINILFGVVPLVGITLLLVTKWKTFRSVFALKGFKPNETEVTAIFLTICFFVSFFGVIVFHPTYTIVDDKVIINYKITPRYLIPVQLFWTFGFVYSISNHTWNNVNCLIQMIRRNIKFQEKSSYEK